MSDKKKGGRLENWVEHPYLPTIIGDVYDDPSKRFTDGTNVQTSKIVKLDKENNTLETLNTIYELGKHE